MWELMKKNSEEAHIQVTTLQAEVEAARVGRGPTETEQRCKELEIEVEHLALQLGAQGEGERRVLSRQSML